MYVVGYFGLDIGDFLLKLSLIQKIFTFLLTATTLFFLKNSIASYLKEKFSTIRNFNLRNYVKLLKDFIINNDFETVMNFLIDIGKNKFLKNLALSILSMLSISIFAHVPRLLIYMNPASKFISSLMLYLFLRIVLNRKFFLYVMNGYLELILFYVFGLYSTAIISYFTDENLFYNWGTDGIILLNTLGIDVHLLFPTANKLAVYISSVYFLVILILIVLFFVSRKFLESIFSIIQRIIINLSSESNLYSSERD
jgi:hypothetical protein